MMTFTRIIITTIIFSLVGLAFSSGGKSFWIPDKDGLIDVTPVKTKSEKDCLNDTLAQEFLCAHNKERKVAGQPDYLWDNVIADYARSWAKDRAKDCKMIHSYGPYGENLFWGNSPWYTAKYAVESWIKEKVDYDPKKNKCINGRMCGHYTQIIWRDSLNLGCARQICNNGSVFIICSYNPPGNFADEKPCDIHRHDRKQKYNWKTRQPCGAPLASPSSSDFSPSSSNTSSPSSSKNTPSPSSPSTNTLTVSVPAAGNVIDWAKGSTDSGDEAEGGGLKNRDPDKQ